MKGDGDEGALLELDLLPFSGEGSLENDPPLAFSPNPRTLDILAFRRLWFWPLPETLRKEFLDGRFTFKIDLPVGFPVPEIDRVSLLTPEEIRFLGSNWDLRRELNG